MASSSKSLEIPDVHVNFFHLAIAAALLFTMAAYVFCRRPVVIISSVALGAASIFGHVEPHYFLGSFTVLLVLSSEYIVAKSRGTRSYFPVICSLVVSSMALIFSGLVVYISSGTTFLPTWPYFVFLVAIVTTLPWLSIISSLVLIRGQHGYDVPDNALDIEITKQLVRSVSVGISGLLLSKPRDDASYLEFMSDLEELEYFLSSMSFPDRAIIRNLIAGAALEVEDGNIIQAKSIIIGNSIFQECQKSYRFRCKALSEAVNSEHGFLVRNLLALIHSYRLIVPSNRRRACRFTPTCSEYAERALLHKGARLGLKLATVRSFRCVSHGDSGWDPVSLR
jgi:uncharacterized protein